MSFPNHPTSAAELSGHIAAVPNLSAPSTTKFDAVRAWFARGLGVTDDEVYVVFVSKPGNLKVRFDQSGWRGRLGVAVVRTAEDLERCVRAGRQITGADRVCEAMAFCAPHGEGDWTVPACIGDADDEAVRELARAFPGLDQEAPLAETVTGSKEARDVGDLADSLFLPRDWIERLLWLLDDKRGIVLYGPPGTGKTYIGKKIAEHIQPDAELRRLVQLHPSYGYEDFFEGYRPMAVADAGMVLEKHAGPLKSLSEDARARPEEKAILLLDELNRGNLPRVFGELFFLLEYRHDSVRLMYSPEEDFRLPENLLLIGTMNTADRSIAHLDQALRRRFHFVPLFPGDHIVDDMLVRFIQKHHPAMSWVPDVLYEANRILGDRNVAIGPSHFMRSELDDETVRRIWQHSVLPTIEDQLLGRADRLDEFELDALRKATEASEEIDDVGE